MTAKGKHLQDTFQLDIHDDVAPSGDLFADAERCQWEAKLVLGDNTLSGNLGKLMKFGLMMRENFSVVSLSIRGKTSRGCKRHVDERIRW